MYAVPYSLINNACSNTQNIANPTASYLACHTQLAENRTKIDLEVTKPQDSRH